MISVSIARHSRRLALAGMVNAARIGADLVELRLDTFENAPDVAELLAAKRTPVMVSCLRPRDGGVWAGSESDRLALLRQAMLAGADYVAIEQDVAEEIPPHEGTKRVITYTNTEETPAELGAIVEACLEHKPDVIQVTCKARTPEEAWPMVQLLKKPAVPVALVGLGWGGLLPALLGKKYGAAWVSAASERGTEAYPGQPTVRELVDIYRYPEINAETEWVGVTGGGPWEELTAALLNATFAAQGSGKRCLPMAVGDPDRFARFVSRLHLRGVVLALNDQQALRSMATSLDDQVRFAAKDKEEEVESAVDVLIADAEGEGWRGASILPRAALAALRANLARRERTLEGAVVVFVGLTPAAAGLARGVRKHGGLVVFADRDQALAKKFAGWFGGRFIRPEAIHTTLHDVTILCAEPGVDPDLDLGEPPTLHPGFLKSGMTLLDLTGLPKRTPLLREAAARGAAVVEPPEVLFEHVRRLVYRLRGEEAPRKVLKRAIRELLTDKLVSESDFNLVLGT